VQARACSPRSSARSTARCLGPRLRVSAIAGLLVDGHGALRDERLTARDPTEARLQPRDAVPLGCLSQDLHEDAGPASPRVEPHAAGARRTPPRHAASSPGGSTNSPPFHSTSPFASRSAIALTSTACSRDSSVKLVTSAPSTADAN